MFTEKDVRDLAEYVSPDPILSVYLNTDPSRGNADIYKLQLRNMLKNVNLPDDVIEVEKYLTMQHEWAGRGLIIFSCFSQEFFRSFTVAMPVPSFVHIGNRPSIKPMTSLLYNYGGYGVVLIDQQGARLFSFHLGELREQEGLLGETIKKVKTGGGSSAAAGQRGGSASNRLVEEYAERNMRDVANYAIKFFEDNKIRRILIGGTEDNLAAFRTMLPKAWQSLVVGTFPMNMSATATEVLDKVMVVSEENEKQREVNLAQDMVTMAAKGGLAVIGIEDSLDVVNNNRVQSLIVEEEFHHAGYICEKCNNLLSLKPVCPVCEGKGKPVTDIVEEMVGVVLRSGGGIEVLAPNAPMRVAQHIGAFLRY